MVEDSKLDIVNSEDRIFEAFLSTEVTDSQGDKISADDLMKHMDILMKRGGFISDSHSNRIIGKFLNYRKENQMNVPGVYVKGLVFNDYPADHEVWKEIKNGKRKGLSIGGEALEKLNENGEKTPVLKALYEGSVVDTPSNSFAVFTKVNYLAKSELRKPMGDYKNFDDCVKRNQDKRDPESYCGKIYHEIEGKSIGGIEMKKQEEKKPEEKPKEPKESQEKKPKEETEEEKKQEEVPVEAPSENGLEAKIADLTARLSKIEAFVTNAMQEEKPTEIESQDEEETEEEKKEVEPVKPDQAKEPEKIMPAKKEILKAVQSEVSKYFEKHSMGRPAVMQEEAHEKDYALKIAKGETKFDFQKAKEKELSSRDAEIKKILGY